MTLRVGEVVRVIKWENAAKAKRVSARLTPFVNYKRPNCSRYYFTSVYKRIGTVINEFAKEDAFFAPNPDDPLCYGVFLHESEEMLLFYEDELEALD